MRTSGSKSERLIRQRNQEFQKKVTKRGTIVNSKEKAIESKLPVAPWIVGLFIFVVVGSALLSLVGRG